MLKSKFKNVKRVLYSGYFLLFTVAIYVVALSLAFSIYVPDLQLEFVNIIHFLGINFKSLGYLMLISFSAFLYGNLFKRLELQYVDFKIGIGLIVLISHLFIFASFGYLNLYSVLWVILLPLALQVRQVPKLLKTSFIKPVDLAQLNIIGFFSLSLLIFFLLVNFTLSLIHI